MARKKQSSKKSNKDKSNPGAEEAVDGFILVDPARCRFQHSRIRPQFSGCGRDVVQVLEDIKSGKTNLQDLPPIQVLVGSVDDSSDDDDGSIWYFSLNNRRLWILKLFELPISVQAVHELQEVGVRHWAKQKYCNVIIM